MEKVTAVQAHYVLGFGHPSGEMCRLTTDNTGPTGNTGKIYRLVRTRR